MKSRLYDFVPKVNTQNQITISHVTVRQSISVLLIKLVILDCFGAFFIILYFFSYSQYGNQVSLISRIISNYVIFFIVLGLFKIFLTLFVVVQWLDEYYEISPQSIIHKKGLLFRHDQKYDLSHIASIKMEQSSFGKLFNYGTLFLFNWNLEEYANIYMIHNPTKYLHILENLLPQADEEKHVLREHLLEEDDS